MAGLSTYSLRTTIAESREEMGTAAGICGEQLLVSLLGEKETVRIIMGSAPSQDEVLGYVRDSTKIDWSRVEIFHMDEYIGVSPENPVSFSNYLERTVIGQIPVKGFHKMIIDPDNPEASCLEYSRHLMEAPIDLVFLGIGENGHIAFNDPAMADLKDPLAMKVVTLDAECRMQQVHDGCFANFDLVPQYAVTLTVPTLMSGRHLICTVPGRQKNNACLCMLMGPVSAECPATAIRVHRDCHLFLDHESGRGVAELETAILKL